MELNGEARKALAAKLLEELTTVYLAETEAFCNELNYKIEDLLPLSPENFISKGVTSDLKDIRYTHYEERRIAKIIKIATEISKNLQGIIYIEANSLKMLISGISTPKISRTNSSSHSSRSDGFSYYTNPREFIAFGLGKEKEKFNRSLKALERISFLRDEAKIKTDMKVKNFQDKDNTIVKNRNHRDSEFQRTVSSNIEKRKKILEKKYEILGGIDKIMAEYGVNLEKRMTKLSEVQKIEIRRKLKKKQHKLKKKLEDERKKFEMDQKRTHDESIFAGEMMDKIQRKIDTRVNEYLNLVQLRIQTARYHSLKVNHTLKTCLRIESMNKTENLRKSINKSLMSTKKIEKKNALANESSGKIRQRIIESFEKHQRGISDITTEEMKRMERIKARQDSKQKLFADIRKKISHDYEEKKQKNFIRMENHFRTYIEKQRYEVIII